MNPAVMVWSLTSEDFYRKYIEEIAVPIAVAPQGQGRWAKLRWLRSLVNKARPAVLHSMAFFLNSAATWATVMSPTIAIGAIRGDYRFERSNSATDVCTMRLIAIGPRLSFQTAIVPGGTKLAGSKS